MMINWVVFRMQKIRVVFRFLFTLPLMIIALDGLAAPYPVVGDPSVTFYSALIALWSHLMF